jgi:hypothetical protein
MKISLAILLVLAASLASYAQPALPRMASVDPDTAKVGDSVVVTGENLDKASVAKLYLTDGKNDLVAEVLAQTATTIKFKIPAKATGRMAIMVLTTGKEPQLIEQPVKVLIGDAAAAPAAPPEAAAPPA